MASKTGMMVVINLDPPSAIECHRSIKSSHPPHLQQETRQSSRAYDARTSINTFSSGVRTTSDSSTTPATGLPQEIALLIRRRRATDSTIYIALASLLPIYPSTSTFDVRRRRRRDDLKKVFALNSGSSETRFVVSFVVCECDEF